MTIYVAGLDLGQLSDYTALTIDEAEPSCYEVPYHYQDAELHVMAEANMTVEGGPVSHRIRHLERFPKGTEYPAIVERVESVLRRVPGGCLLAVDATGVGRPVVDLLVRAGLGPVAVTITGGSRPHGEGTEWHVPKADLVGVLQVALQNRRLAIAKELPAAELLARELQNFKVKITAAANVTFSAWRESDHDDLVLAVALAAWLAEAEYGARADVQVAQAEIATWEAEAECDVRHFPG